MVLGNGMSDLEEHTQDSSLYQDELVIYTLKNRGAKRVLRHHSTLLAPTTAPYLYRKSQGTHKVAADLYLLVNYYFPIINFSTKFKLRASVMQAYRNIGNMFPLAAPHIAPSRIGVLPV
jgi:hypothetical protein